MPFGRRILAVLLAVAVCCGLTACWGDPTPVTITSKGFDPKTVYETNGVQFINQTDRSVTLCVMMHGLQCDPGWFDGNSDSGKFLMLKPGQTSAVGFGCSSDPIQVELRDKPKIQITI